MESRKIELNISGLLVFLLISILVLPSFASATAQSLNIAMVLWRGETEAEEGFKDGLEELGYTAVYTNFDSQQDVKKLGLMLREILRDTGRFEYIYTFGTTVSRRAKLVINRRVPQIFNAVTDPVGAGIARSLGTPGEFIGGASDAISLTLQVQGMLGVMAIHKLGFFFNPREKNSMLIRGELYQLALKNGFEVVDFRSPPTGKLLEDNLQRLIDDPTIVDAVFFPSDSYLASRADYIGRKLSEARIASFGSLEEYIENGLLMGFVVDYYRLGKALAEVVVRHQKEGTFREISTVVPSTYKRLINIRTKQLLEIEIPEPLLKNSIYLY